MPSPHWNAPVADGPVDATVRLPGSKSMTNRALILAALADDPVCITRPLHSRDTELMADALRALGASIGEDSGPRGSSPRTGADWQTVRGDAPLGPESSP